MLQHEAANFVLGAYENLQHMSQFTVDVDLKYSNMARRGKSLHSLYKMKYIPVYVLASLAYRSLSHYSVTNATILLI